MLVKDAFKLFQPLNDKTGSIDYIITWVALYDYHHDPYCHPDIKISSDCKPELVLSEKVLNSRVIEMSAEDLDVILIRIEKLDECKSKDSIIGIASNIIDSWHKGDNNDNT